MGARPMVRIRIHFHDSPPVERHYEVGLSQAVAEYPQAWRVELADEADRREGVFW